MFDSLRVWLMFVVLTMVSHLLWNSTSNVPQVFNAALCQSWSITLKLVHIKQPCQFGWLNQTLKATKYYLFKILKENSRGNAYITLICTPNPNNTQQPTLTCVFLFLKLNGLHYFQLLLQQLQHYLNVMQNLKSTSWIWCDPYHSLAEI